MCRNYHFIWLAPSDISADQLQSQNASVVRKLDVSIPQFHSRAVRQRFICLFGRVASVKPAYLQEIYHQLTGDTSTSSNENERHIDERMRQALDREDVEVVTDVKHHNKAHASKYEPFCKACERYIENTIELAAGDREHDHIAHLVIALSVNDQL